MASATDASDFVRVIGMQNPCSRGSVILTSLECNPAWVLINGLLGVIMAAVKMHNSTSDNAFGPVIAQYFDFTKLFVDTILSILPSVLFLCLFPLRLFQLWRRPRTVTGGALHTNKLVVLSIFAALQVMCLGFWAAPTTQKSSAALLAAILTVADALALGVLSHLEHLRSVRPSLLINLYILFTLPMDGARARTLWVRGSSLNLAAVFTSTVSIKTIVLFVEAFEKRDILLSQYRHFSPEATSGIYSRSFFWWVNPLLRNGFRKVLTDEDLYPVDEDMKSKVVEQLLQNQWAKEKHKMKHNRLLWRTLWAVRYPLLRGVFPRLCVTAFQYAQPFLVAAVVDFLVHREDHPNPYQGWFLTAAYGLDYLGLAIANGAYMHETYRTVTIVRGSLVTAIYRQTIDLKLTSVDESAALTLMSTDVEKIGLAFEFFHGLWSSPFEIALGVYLLQARVGLASLGPVLVTAVSGGIVVWTAFAYTSKAQLNWVQAVQTRIDATSKILSGMKAVKMLGLTETMQTLIQQLRLREIQRSLWLRQLFTLRIFCAKGAEAFAPGVMFAAFTIISNSTGQVLDIGTAYSALSIVGLLMAPLGLNMQALPMFTAALGCFDRIQKFLNLPAQRDHRLRGTMGTQLTSQPSSHPNEIELQDISPKPMITPTSMIEVNDASFSWIENEHIIQNVSFSIMARHLTMVIGPVGSGKSTLLKGLVGETPSTKGFVYSREMQVGFVDQTSWIQNGSLRSNILGISVYERDWYASVVHACALQDDIDNLPSGDQTRVGSAGISLSGGQKQRLALARAVYSRKKLVILDDCFSGLDASTEEKIFNRLLGKTGLLRKQGITVVLVTHAVHRLPFADHIISLTRDGHIGEQGSFAYLMDNGNYVPSVAAKRQLEVETPLENESILPVESYRNPTVGREIERAAEDVKRQVGDWTTYAYYLRAVGRLNAFLFVVSAIGFGVFMKIPDLWITFWAAGVKLHGNSVNGFYLGIYLMFCAISALSIAAVCHTNMTMMAPLSAKRLHETILKTVMAAPLLFFTSTDLGVTVNRFSQDMSLVDLELPQAVLNTVAVAVLAIVEAVLMCLSAGYFAASMPFVIVVLYVLQQYYLRTSRQLRLLDLEAKSPLYSHFMETLAGLITVRAFGWSDEFESKNSRLLDISQKPFYLLFCIQRWLALVLDLTVAALTVLLMVIVVKLRDTVNPGFVALALVNVNAFNMSLTELVKAWTVVETSIGAVTRCKSFAAETPNENLPQECESVPEGLVWPSKGNIEFKDFCAYYRPKTIVLKNLNLSIHGGEKIGICGGSGSGKSTIIAALFRMLETSSGSVTIDGVDIANLPRREVRNAVNAIPQEAYFFKGSVRDNIDPTGRCSNRELEDALKRVTLWSIVEEKGGIDAAAEPEMFSHGQRQLFCLARAILHPSKIIVLDEATSSVDLKTDELMQKIIREAFENCTILAVAHRLDTILDFDRIAVIKFGELLEFDTPKALMARDSAFKALYESSSS